MSNTANANSNNSELAQPNLVVQLEASQQVSKIPLAHIRPSQNNPRKIITQEMIDTRAASMAEGGQTTPITLLPLTPAEGEVLYEIIDGELRYRAALKLNWTAIDASIKPMSARKAYKTRIAANRTNKPIWFEDYLAMEELVNEPEGLEKMQKQQIADLFEVKSPIVSRALKILKVVNLTSRDLLLKNFQNPDQDWDITENALYRLADLGEATAVEAALRVVLDKHMTEPQAKALVASMKAGTPAHEHVITPKAPKKPKSSGSAYGEPTPGSHSEPEQPSHASRLVGSRQAALPPELASQVVEMPTKAEASSTPHHTHAPKLAEVGSVSPSGISALKGPQPADSMGTAETVAFDALAGVSVIAKIKTKLKKGERPTAAETLLLAGHGLWTAIHFLGKHGFKFVKWMAKETWKLSKESLKLTLNSLGSKVKKTVKTIFIILFWALLLVTAWDIHERGWWHPVHVIGATIAPLFSHKVTTPPPVTEQTQPNTSSLSSPSLVARPASASSPQDEKQGVSAPISQQKGMGVVSQQAPTKKARVAKASPASSYQAARPFDPNDADAKQFEAEMASLPNYCRVSDYALTPDNTMAGDMAYRRLSDLSNRDKYAMKIGGGTQKVLNVQVSTTNLTINYQNDISALLGGSSKMDFYWEDVKAVHTNQITMSPHNSSGTPEIIYQLSVVISGAKQPLIVQSSNALDMQRLVSALDNYLRAARLPALPLGGMPYPQPGLRLNDKNEVTLLWADSPAGKAGVAVKDIVWSLEKNNANQTDKKLLETQLRALNPGTHPLYLVKPADWAKAQIALSMGTAIRFNPKRQLVNLAVQ